MNRRSFLAGLGCVLGASTIASVPSPSPAIRPHRYAVTWRYRHTGETLSVDGMTWAHATLFCSQLESRHPSHPLSVDGIAIDLTGTFP